MYLLTKSIAFTTMTATEVRLATMVVINDHNTFNRVPSKVLRLVMTKTGNNQDQVKKAVDVLAFLIFSLFIYIGLMHITQ